MKIIKNNNIIQRVIKKAMDNPNFNQKLNNGLPMIETTIATLAYSAAIYRNKDIEAERKPSLHYQNIICGASGLLLSSKINNFINKYQEQLCKELEKRNIHKMNNLINGIKVAVPIVVFSMILRLIIPIVSVPISTYIENKRKNIHK